MTPEQIKNKYQKRIIDILQKIADTLYPCGYKVEGPYDMSGDDYEWSLLVDTPTAKIDIAFRICESETYDGERGGVNFALDIVEQGGRILGGLIPHNYSNQVWVSRKDPEAIEERFKLLEETDPDDTLNIIRRNNH